MNIIALTDSDFSASGTPAQFEQCVLQDKRATHIHRTLKSTIGDTLRVGLVNGLLGTAIISAMTNNTSTNDTTTNDTVTLHVTLEDQPPAPLPITLFLALPRPNMIARLLRDVTSLGIKNIHLFHSEKVEKSFWQTPTLFPETIREKLTEGLSQARDTVLPQVHTHQQYRAMLDTVLPASLATHVGILADPYSPQAVLPAQFEQPLALVIGPEGGFTDKERDDFLQLGCKPLWLGSRILRVETAVLTAVGNLGTRVHLP